MIDKDECFNSIKVTPEQCRTCQNRLKEANGRKLLDGWQGSICEVYRQYGDKQLYKPHKIMTNEATCKHYKRDEAVAEAIQIQK